MYIRDKSIVDAQNIQRTCLQENISYPEAKLMETVVSPKRIFMCAKQRRGRQ